MTQPVPRLRMFAGPNGSGKSTLKDHLQPHWLGVYVNADDIEKCIRTEGKLSLQGFDIVVTEPELTAFLAGSRFLVDQCLGGDVERIRLRDGVVEFDGLAVNSYHASVLADFIRHKLMDAKVSFTFETVMSSPEKVDFVCKARQAGYRTYLYYVATEDPEIKVSRVAHRVSTGGHPVPKDKIVSRYYRSLSLLNAAVACTDRAYVFDNSCDDARVLVAEVTDGNELEMKTDLMPYWFKTAVWDKFGGGEMGQSNG